MREISGPVEVGGGEVKVMGESGKSWAEKKIKQAVKEGRNEDEVL